MGNYILVAGSRGFDDMDRLEKILEENLMADDTIVEGGARGVDTMARQWAEARGISFIEMKADWAKYGKAAGPKRNDAMVEFVAEHKGRALFIWDGKSKGTKQCIQSAMKKELSVMIYQEDIGNNDNK